MKCRFCYRPLDPVDLIANQRDALAYAVRRHRAEWQKFNGTRPEVARPDDVALWAVLEVAPGPAPLNREDLEQWMLAYVDRFDAGDMTTDEDLCRMAVIADLRAHLDAADSTT